MPANYAKNIYFIIYLIIDKKSNSELGNFDVSNANGSRNILHQF